MPLSHFLLALAVVAVWGTNFVVIKAALAHLPPLLFAALRFLFAAFPAMFFLRRPAVRWRELAAYGVLIGAGQFGLLFIAMNGRISPGLASLVIQVQVFFTIGMAMWLTRERVQAYQVAALLLALAGIVIIGGHTGGSTTAVGLALVLVAALCWAGCNIVARRAGSVNMLAYVVWASIFAVPPLFILSFWLEGWPVIQQGLTQLNAATATAVLWQSTGNTLFGFAAWGWLLARHPAATVSPMALLVPVFGIGASAWVLGEPLPGWKLGSAALVMIGLAVNVLWPRWQSSRWGLGQRL